jgi:6-pyruvoyltetrahydropterin/6-carboxytetrahydropterin synthase
MVKMMKLEVNCELQCAHKLTVVLPGSKCQRLHGHTYYVKVVVGGVHGRHNQFMVDVDVVRGAIMQLDHHYLNERLPELGFCDGEPTLEYLVNVIDQMVRKELHGTEVDVVQVEVQEGSGGIARLG